MILYLDTETYSEVPLQQGTHRYAENASVIMWQYAIDDGDVMVSDDLTDELRALLMDDSIEIVIHNSAFDRAVIRHATGIDLPVSRIFDTMVCALSHSFPGGLDSLCEILSVDKDKAKDKEGKKWINLFCKPQKKRDKTTYRVTKEDRPEEWAKFCEYGRLDIIAMREIYKKLPTWNYKGFERELWELDQKINDRGICVDLDLANAAIRAAGRAQEEYAAETVIMTDGEVTSTNRRDKLLEHILSRYKVKLDNLTSATVEKLLESGELPPELLDLLAIRLEASKTSTTKYKRVIGGVSGDGRLRGLLQFCGAARTGRWAGRLFQPQNLPRPSIKSDPLEDYINDLKCNAEGL